MSTPLSPELVRHADRLFCDPVFFSQEIFREMGWDRHSPIGWVEADMIEFAVNGPRYSGLLGFRGLGKTTLITVCVTCYDLFRDPEAKVLVLSKSGGHAKKAKKLIREVISKVSFLKHLTPRPPEEGRIWRDNDECLDVGPSKPSKDPSVWAVGIDGQLPGSRASRVIPDDVETKDNTVTLEARKALEEKLTECKAIASFGDRRITYVGTFHHEQSVYLAIAQKGYTFRSYPVLFPQQDDKIHGLSPAYRERLEDGRAKPGDIAAPYRFTSEFITDAKAEGRTFFAMQYMLVANLGDENRYPLKLSDFIVFSPLPDKAPFSIVWGRSNGQGSSTCRQDIPSYGFGSDALYGPIMFDPTLVPFQGTKMWIDPAGKGADNTGFAITAFANGTIYAKAVGSDERGSQIEVMHRIASLARLHKVNDIYIEDFGLQSMFGQILEPIVRTYFIAENDPKYPDLPAGWRCSVQMQKPKNPGSMKEDRIIQALEPVLSTHRLVISEEVICSERLQRQLTRICRQRGCLKHEDELESLANACQLWEDRLGATQDMGIKRKLEDAYQATLDRYAGVASRSPNWCN